MNPRIRAGSIPVMLIRTVIVLGFLSASCSDLSGLADEATDQITNATEEKAPSISRPKTFESIEELTRHIGPSIVTIRVKGRDGEELSIGTGFVLSADGQIVTNAHVIGEGRSFTIELPSGRALPVTEVESTDQTADLAVIRVDVGDAPLTPLKRRETKIAQGTRVAAYGNPLGLRDSVVAGIVSAIREVQGRELIQLAMPIQPGNSGGPLVDMQGNVRGIINMKSAVDDNLGFAIPIDQLTPILSQPHPVSYNRWVTLGRMDPKSWTTQFGASWQQRGGVISARGSGQGFGGRSLCLSKRQPLDLPMEIAVDVRLDDESGAAGLAFCSDGNNRHYGFYPSNGNLRLTCFKGPSVYTWEVLADLNSNQYQPKKWNRLRVRIEKDRFLCFVNDELLIESKDSQLTGGSVGLVKFRETQPDFKRFQVGKDLAIPALTSAQEDLITRAISKNGPIDDQDETTVQLLAESSEAVSRKLEKRAANLEKNIQQLRRLANDIELAPTLLALRKTFEDPLAAKDQLFRGALLIAKIDNPDTDPSAYMKKVESMASEIREGIGKDFSDEQKRKQLDQYLFNENGFRGGSSEYYHPANSHLDRVIDEREGLPITLSILYMELGRRIGLTMEGIGLPGHFVVRHLFENDDQQLIDVFDRGKTLSSQDSEQIVRDFANRELVTSDLIAQSDQQILSRVLNNLLSIARRDSDTEAFRRYCEALVAIAPEDPEARIMRSQARALTKRFQGAVEDVNWLIERIPEGVNRAQAIQLRDSLLESQSRESEVD